MKFNELSHMMQKPEPKPDTYEAGMALNQLLKIGTHAIKIHNMIDDDAEMEAWVAKKIDLAGDYVKKVHGYMQGEKAGLYDDGGLTEDADAMDWSTDKVREFGDDLIKVSKGQVPDDLLNIDDLEDGWADADQASRDEKAETIGGQLISVLIGYLQFSAGQKPSAEDIKGAQEVVNDPEFKKAFNSTESVLEDAGEGHMSKSTLYHTAKYAIELMDMINKGDDLEGWVQTKLNLAADYLQAVYHYEDYQKLNPYREELDGSLMQRHAGIIQKHLDEILERKCRTEDVDTKPGMMRILKKRVNEVEKEIAKENRKETNEEATIKPYVSMYRGKDGKMVYDVLDKHEKSAFKTSDERVAKAYLSKNYDKLREAALDEGIREWGKRLAMAGVIVAGLAGVNSINNAIDNSIPAVKAMNTALEMAQDSGNDELAKMIEKDLSDAKIRLTSGKDLTHVADLQDKYAKFMKTEGLAYESKLAVNLKQRLK